MVKYKYYIIVLLLLLVLAAKKMKAMDKKKTTMQDPTFYKLLPLQAIRIDSSGDGNYESSRTGHKHQGVDLIVVPGEKIYAPFTGVLVREAAPYANDSNYKGFVFRNIAGDIEIKIFYAAIIVLPGAIIQQGAPIATAQNISKKYSGSMKPHIHVEIRKNKVVINPTKYLI